VAEEPLQPSGAAQFIDLLGDSCFVAAIDGALT